MKLHRLKVNTMSCLYERANLNGTLFLGHCRAINERDIIIKQLQEELLETKNERDSLKAQISLTKHADH